VQFAAVTAPLIGNVTGNLTGDVTGNADTATSLETARTISLGGDLSGSASFDGTSNVTITATVQPDSVALGADTTGNFMSDVVGGTGVTVSHTPGESSSASISIGQDVATSASVTFAAVTAPVVGNVTGDLTGNADTATALETARTISLTGDVSGSVSFDGAGDVSITATVQPDSVALGTDTTGNFVNDLTAGTGVIVTHTPGEGSSPTVAIGQSVATSASVTFAQVDTTGDVVVGGNLTVNGTTTTLNTETLAIEDNIVVLNSNVTSSPTTNAGIEVERGTSANVSFRWNETSDKWEFTEDGSTFYDIATEDFVLAQSVASLDEIGDVSASAAVSGDFLKYDGAAWVNDPINLGTDTVGNYMLDITAGTGLTVSHTAGEGSSASVSLNATLDDLSNVTAPSPSDGNFLKYVSASSAWIPASIPTINALDDIGDVSAAAPTTGQFLQWNGTAWVPADVTSTATTSVSASTATTVDSFNKTTYRTADYLIQVTQGTKYTSMKATVLHDGTTSYVNKFGIIEIGSPPIPLTISTDISGSDVRLRVAIIDANLTNASVKVIRTSIAV
jgi:hypothetical protein